MHKLPGSGTGVKEYDKLSMKTLAILEEFACPRPPVNSPNALSCPPAAISEVVSVLVETPILLPLPLKNSTRGQECWVPLGNPGIRSPTDDREVAGTRVGKSIR